MTIEVIFWIVIAVMAFLAFRLWLAEMLGESESQKRIDRINKEADELIKQALIDLMEWHHLQRTSVARSEYEGYLKLATNKMRSRAPGVIEL